MHCSKCTRERALCPPALGRNSPPSTGAELLTLAQTAALCGVSQRTLWDWANSGIAPPALKIGKRTVRYSRAAYLEWVKNGCRPVQGGHGDGQQINLAACFPAPALPGLQQTRLVPVRRQP